MNNFGKVLTAMVTPFNADLQVDYQQVKVLANHLAENGSDGIVVAGTTGESPTLTAEEKVKLFSTVKAEVGDKVKVIAGTGSNNTAESVELSQEAAKIGVDGIMLVVPYYNKPTQQGLYHHFSTIAKEVKTSVMLYNVPGRTGANLLSSTVKRLAEIENIVAIKEASGDLDQVTEIRANTPNEFAIYSGDDSLTLPMLSLGSSGVVSVASHIVGNQISEMITSFEKGDFDKALKYHLKLYPIFKSLFITSNPVPVKTALNLNGIDVGGTRAPLFEPSADEVSQIQSMLSSLDG